jgi:hypothetical protein
MTRGKKMCSIINDGWRVMDECIVLLTIVTCLGPWCYAQFVRNQVADMTGYEVEVSLYEELMTRYSFSWYVDVFVALGVSLLSCALLAALAGPEFALRLFPAAAWLSLGIVGYANRYFLHHNLNQHQPIMKPPREGDSVWKLQDDAIAGYRPMHWKFLTEAAL